MSKYAAPSCVPGEVSLKEDVGLDMGIVELRSSGQLVGQLSAEAAEDVVLSVPDMGQSNATSSGSTFCSSPTSPPPPPGMVWVPSRGAGGGVCNLQPPGDHTIAGGADLQPTTATHTSDCWETLQKTI